MTESKKEPTKLAPILSEFATQEEADEYDAWFRKQVQAALDDPRPGIPHDEAMARIRSSIEQAAARGLAEGKQAAYDASQATVDYDAWLDREIDESLDDPRPSIPHEQVVREIDEIIRAAKERHQRKAE
jgi:hypothetical protein